MSVNPIASNIAPPKPFFTQVTQTVEWVWDLAIQNMVDFSNGLLAVIARIINYVSSFFETEELKVQPELPKAPPSEPAPLKIPPSEKISVEVAQKKTQEPEPVLPKATPAAIPQPQPPAPPVAVPVVQVEVQPPELRVPEEEPPAAPVVDRGPKVEQVGIFGLIEHYFFQGS